MEETKTCPFCGSEIPSLATRCKYCREWLHQDTDGLVLDHKSEATGQIEEELLRQQVAKVLAEEKNFLKAVELYSQRAGVSTSEARKYVDTLNGILRSWWPKGGIHFSCPHCNASIGLAETRCPECGQHVQVTLPKEKKPEVKDRSGIKAKQAIPWISVLAFFLIVKQLIKIFAKYF